MTLTSPASLPELAALRVLVVDDDADTLKLMRVMFERMGVRDVLTFANPHEALDLGAERRPDMVLSDWEMGAMEGHKFVARFREGPAAAPHTGYYFITGRPVTERVEEARRLRVNGFLAKPVSPGVLRTHVARFLGITLPPPPARGSSARPQPAPTNAPVVPAKAAPEGAPPATPDGSDDIVEI